MKKYVFVIILALALMLQGCSGKEESGSIPSDSTVQGGEMNNEANVAADENAATTEPTQEPTEEPTQEPTQAPTQVPALVLPVTSNETGKVLIQTVSQSSTYPYNSYIISSINGENVVVDPTEMPKKEVVDINPVAIVNTHNHPDHINPPFSRSYDCQKLEYVKGEIKTNDFNIYSILSSHNSDEIKEPASNVLIVFEVDGLRIVHMGDIGQTKLTDEQLADLGEIDIAFMQFENSYSTMDLKNMKGFNLIEQLNPKIIIPTHFTKASLTELETRYGAITEVENVLEISKEELPEDTMNVYHITNTHKYR